MCSCGGICTGSAAAVAAGMAAFALGSDWNGSLRIPVSVTSFLCKFIGQIEDMNWDSMGFDVLGINDHSYSPSY